MKTKLTPANFPSHEHIAVCAYLISEREGCPDGLDIAHWLEAEAHLTASCIHDAGLSQRGSRARRTGGGGGRSCMKISTALIIAAGGWLAAGCFDAAEAQTLSQEDVVATVLAENAALKSARAKWTAMRERVPQAKAWDDPMAGVDLERMGSTRLAPVSDAEWMVSQSLPLSGKNLSRARTAEAEARAAFEDARRTKLDLVAKARTAYFRLANARAQLGVNERSRGLIQSFADISRKRYEIGAVTQGDVLAAETDLNRLLQDRVGFERDIVQQQSALNVLMNRPATAPLGEPAPLTFKRLPWSQNELRPLALASRPEVAGAERRIAAEQGRLQLAKRQWFPDPQVRIEARSFRESSQAITEYDTGIFFSIPWGNARKYSAGVREAEQSLEAASREHELARTEALGMVRDRLAQITALGQQYELSRDKLIPLAQQTVQALQAGYESGKAGFLELITAQRIQRDVEAAALNQLMEYRVALSELEAAVGIERDAEKRRPASTR